MSQNIFRNPFVTQAPSLSGSSVGNGTLTIDRLTHFTIDQTYTAICSAIAPFTVFNIVGSLDGIVGVAVVGDQFTDEDNKIFLTIQQGPVLFQVGDTFEFIVSQGTDLNQQNLDVYDELPQKNFGTGITGQNKGNNNIRFSSAQIAAFKNIGDLAFTAKELGPAGNAISIEYTLGTILTAAKRTIQGLLFTANAAGADGNEINIEVQEGSPGTVASLVFQNVEYQANSVGVGGNDISIRYVSGGTAGFEVVSVIGKAITVQIENGVSTATDIALAVALNPNSSALVEVFETDTGSETQVIQAATFLAGGVDPTAIPVEVTGNDIVIRVQNGVETLSQVKAMIDASLDALTLVSVEITGNPDNVFNSPVEKTYLIDGADNAGNPGNEGITVVDNQIFIAQVSSTAAQIKTALEAVSAVTDLIDITLLGSGSEVQSSPVARTFLAGGRDAGSFSFNKAELTDPSNFSEGNAPILMTDLINQGKELTLGETIKKGKVTLDDDVSSNLSGPAVINTQQTINNLIQNGKAFLVTADASKVVWKDLLLTFTADIIFCFPDTGFFNTIQVGQSPLTLNDGEHAYVVVDRLQNANVSVQVSATLPQGENVFRLFTRRDRNLIWYDNTLQRDKKKIRIGEGGGGGTGFQEKLGTGNGLGKNFPLTFFPSNETSILVVCSYIRSVGEDYTYNIIGNQIEFINAPAAGQDIYVFYLTDGETLDVPSPTGLLNSYIHTVTSDEEIAKELTLANTPAFPAKTLVDVIGGGTFEYNTDFNISINKFQWAGYALDGLLTEGDKIRFYFYS